MSDNERAPYISCLIFITIHHSKTLTPRSNSASGLILCLCDGDNDNASLAQGLAQGLAHRVSCL